MLVYVFKLSVKNAGEYIAVAGCNGFGEDFKMYVFDKNQDIIEGIKWDTSSFWAVTLRIAILHIVTVLRVRNTLWRYC